ncbi:MAG: DUF2887 domain-containing protein [Moorea sp. SIOASIH]|nr:DUF2887 domain-containing protein [Moorena sp. SIOASIH]
MDGVFLPTTTTAQQPIYFVEVQFQRNSQFYSRFFSEIFLYLNKNEISNDWRGVVIYPRACFLASEIPRWSPLKKGDFEYGSPLF